MKMCSQRQALTILGRLNFANYVIPQGRLHCRNFQRHLRMLRNAHPRRKYVLPGEVLTDLYWWKHAVSKCSLIHLPQITHHLVTDASNLGWGAMLKDTLLSGTWERNQQGWHSNLKELVAIQRAIEARAEDLKGASLLIQSDNSTALAYLRNEGGVKSARLMKQTREPQSKDLAKFLAYLHVKERFKPSTIQLYRSAVSTICEPHLGKKLSEDIFVRHVLKSIAQANPRSRGPIWDPQQVVSWLQNNVPQEVTYFEASRRCAVILLLASGRRVHDLTLLRISPQHFEDNGTDMTFWPVFGSKTDTAKHQQSGWKLNVHEDERICPVFWIRKVIDLLKIRRLSFQQLFITIHGEPKPASRTVIANWVRTVFKAAGIEATPGSTRSAVASYNWIHNVPIDMILQKVNMHKKHFRMITAHLEHFTRK
ncbi:unnamed protein product, partial [Brenthis ino]